MVSIPLPTLNSLHLNDDNLDSAITKSEDNAEKLKAEIDDAEKRIAIDRALASLGMKGIFSTSPTTMDFAEHDRIGDKGSVFIAPDLKAKLARIEDLKLRLHLAEFTLTGLHILKTKRAEIDKAGSNKEIEHE